MDGTILHDTVNNQAHPLLRAVILARILSSRRSRNLYGQAIDFVGKSEHTTRRLALGLQTRLSAANPLDRKLEQSALLLEVMTLLEEKYVDEEKVSDPAELMGNAIQGMVNSLDEHSVYFTPRKAKQFNDVTQGEFQGLGIRIGKVNGWLTVISVLKETPAERAGLLADDRIVFIEEEATRALNLDEATERLKGPAGTVVNLKIARRKEPELLDKAVTRGVIHPTAVDSSRMLDRRTGYIHLQEFTKDAAVDLERKVREFVGEGMDALVLDLRNNSGGLLPVAVQVRDLFIDKGKLIVTWRARAGIEQPYPAQSDPAGDFLLAVLVNEYSASASEIVAGCIQDWKRGIIVGSAGGPKGGKTYGKGSVQTIRPLDSVEGAQIKLTTGKYFTPKDRSIADMKGLTPDILADVTPDQHYSIGANGLFGQLPDEKIPESLRLERPEVTPPQDLKPEDVSPVQIFEEADKNGEEEKQAPYDLELLAAYQHLNTARVIVKGREE